MHLATASAPENGTPHMRLSSGSALPFLLLLACPHRPWDLRPVHHPITMFVHDEYGCRVVGEDPHHPYLPFDPDNTAWAYQLAREAALCCSKERARLLKWTQIDDDPVTWAPVCAFGLQPERPYDWVERRQRARFDARRIDHPFAHPEYRTIAKREGIACRHHPVDDDTRQWCAAICADLGRAVDTCTYIPYTRSECFTEANCGRPLPTDEP